ncbi:probable helicase with zinc finger domain [Culicoides brevitarsis]|uniref:probable helicase with zinc finger domain n=1 Tax=Culicoides brevitarsis TaxID=469753 RepID=UPI00307B2B8E
MEEETLERAFRAFLDQKDLKSAATAFDEVMSKKNCPSDAMNTALLGRSMVCFESKEYKEVLSYTNQLVNSLRNAKNTELTVCLARNFSVRASVLLKDPEPLMQDAKKLVETLKSLEQSDKLTSLATKIDEILDKSTNEQLKSVFSKEHEEIGDICKEIHDILVTELPLDEHTKWLRKRETTQNGETKEENLAKKVETALTVNEVDEKSSESNSCTYCGISFSDKTELRLHCQTQEHQNVLMSDEGREWKWRPPPRGHSAESYSLCDNFVENAICHYGNQCADAHGTDELNEWKERLEYRKTRLQRARETELYGKTYTEQLLDKWYSASSPEKVMKEKIEGVDESCSSELVTTVSSKTSKREWVFMLRTKKSIKAVALMQDLHRNHFVIKQILPADVRAKKGGKEAELTSDQEWVAPATENKPETENTTVNLEHRVKIVFSTDIYGTFRQSVVFDFGTEPVLVKHICVDVIPVTDADKIQEIKKEIVNTTAERWCEDNADVVYYQQTSGAHLQNAQYLADVAREKDLFERYPCPRASTFVLTQTTITEKKLTRHNYRSRMHELLYVEEIARYEQIARYNLTASLKITTNYLLTPSGMATSTAKYSHSGELFALMNLSKDVSEDTSAGRLILNNCASVYVSSKDPPPAGEKRKIYEAVIEDKGKNMIYLKLSAAAVTGLGLKPDTEFTGDIQFLPNRLSYCEWHQAIDKITDYKIIFPETTVEPSIPWTPTRQWDSTLDPKLNAKQKEAIMAITTDMKYALPPILLIGPFGTGKTFTLAQAIKQLLLQPDARILICTHSNSAADLYIKDYLHPWVEAGCEEARPLRVYYHKRWVATVNNIVQKYCLIDLNVNMRNFRRPSAEDILKHRIVVVTLSISMELASLDLPKGHFTHILLDEAAQAMECEAIMPLALASENTRIVLAGDHMQMSPEIFSNFAKERRLHISLLERLYDHYPSDFPCKILLCENYRAHEAIIKYTSELFYEQKLVASGRIPKHEKFYPLTFFTTRGEDVQDKNSTTFYNNAEVYEVVERVCELRKKWPSAWGKINDQSIGIMTPYADQVFRIRSELRKRRMAGISVERVLNVQGKQFRAIFLSTVRTRRTCTNNKDTNSNEEVDYGFLSNSKLLNTAITRAQSLVAVVGDPIALCSIGKCRKIWERFIEICNQNKSLFGITWSLLRSQLDGVELKKTYVLNPLAPEFIPRALQHEAYLRHQTDHYSHYHHPNQYHHSHQNHFQNYHPPHNYRNAGGPPHNMMSHPNMPPGGMNHNQIGPPAYGNGPVPHGMHPNLGPGHPPPPQGPNSQQFPYQNPLYYQNQQMIRGPPPNLQGPQPNAGPPMPFRSTGPGFVNQTPPINMMNQQHAPRTMNMNQNHMYHQPNLLPPRGPPNQFHPELQVPPVQNVRNQLPPPQQPPLRSPGSHNLQMPYGMQKTQQAPYLPPPPQQQTPNQMFAPSQQNALPPNLRQSAAPQMSPAPPYAQHFNQEHHIGAPLPNDILNSMRNNAAVAQQQVVQQKMPYPSLDQQASQARHVENKDFTFLQNVHFPEKLPQIQQQPPSHVHQSHLSSQQQLQPHHGASQNHLHSNFGGSHTSDLSSLLPPNMSFYEMALESKDIQLKWFLRLMETQGIEAANKFTEILRQVPNLMSNSGMNNHQQQPMMPQKTESANDLELDNFFDNLPQPLLKDILGLSTSNAPNLGSTASHGTGLGSSHLLGNGIMGSHSSKSSVDSELKDSHQSVPLYRRQAGQSYSSSMASSTSASTKNHSIASSTPDILETNFFESIEKLSQNFTTSLFNQQTFNNDHNGFQAGLPPLQQLLNQANSQFSHHPANSQQQPRMMNMGSHQMSSQNVQQQQQQRANESVEEMLNRHNSTTYASVLSGAGAGKQPSANNHGKEDPDKDPFTANLCASRKSNGFYNYFQ